MQPIAVSDGVIRFKPNRIVQFICSHADKCVSKDGLLDLNFLGTMDFPQEDVEQFWQLMGYSVSAYGSLSFVSPETAAIADAEAEKIRGTL